MNPKHPNVMCKIGLVLLCFILFSCNKKNNPETDPENDRRFYTAEEFAMGVDLSYVNQVEDHGGTYRDSGEVRDPFLIMKSHGANMVRVRLWHSPVWVRDVYGNPSKNLYSGYEDVEKTIRRAKELGMAVNLDFHYSDRWADPGHQVPPAAWKEITSIDILKDSVYQYTFNVLKRLEAKGLMPEMVQIGNETNCGMMISEVASGFPRLDGCNGYWSNLGAVLNSGIKAVRDASASSSIKPKVALHVADPKNLEWWFGKALSDGKVTDFDIIGFSYYHIWHTEVPFHMLPTLISRLKKGFGKEVMVLETAYPWTTDGADGYGNIFGSQNPLEGYPYTRDGQRDFMIRLTQDVINAGGKGVMYWEPAWITSGMKDLWGTGSAWDNATFFDFGGNALPVVEYMNKRYE